MSKSHAHTSMIAAVDAKTRIAGTNKLEALTFSLGLNPVTGREEIFGINVFKVKEVIKAPPITAAPHMPAAVKGLVSLRGQLIPVIDLGAYAGFAEADENSILILTEYNRLTQGFLVKSVDTILRISWEDMKVPPAMINGEIGGLITAVTTLPSGRLALMLDVERVLSELHPQSNEQELVFQTIEKVHMPEEGIVFFCDDSAIARKQIQRTLEACQIPFRSAINGQEAWETIQKIVTASADSSEDKKLRIKLILTDIEMPEMDGYALTKLIKADARTKDIPVVMHSSLSSNQNQALGKTVGAEYYIPKFKPEELCKAFRHFLEKKTE